MRAMIFERVGKPLELRERSIPEPGAGQVLLKINACAVCRTDLHVVDGELPNPKLPLIVGHEIVGRVTAVGDGAGRFTIGERVGVPWLGWTCGVCEYCRSGRENLCVLARFTGYTIDGGYAEFTVADERFCVLIPEVYSDVDAAPLLCAGLIGYRSLVRAGDGKRLGIYGFGGAAHIITQVAVYQGRSVYAFTKPGDLEGQRFATSLGTDWAGGSDQRPPKELDAAIIFAPVGSLIPAALAAVRKGGIVVCGGIHMSEIPSFSYDLLWGERTVCSVANLTRKDADEFMKVAPRVPVRMTTQPYRLEDANEALNNLRSGKVEGAAVLAIDTAT
ncbi:MAG: zinc-dependent alcohol dehydrogenase family protein [Candidatus Acidiferrales bacterium]